MSALNEPEREPATGGFRPRGSASPAPQVEPMVRILNEVGSWTIGQPLAAGTGDPVLMLNTTSFDELLTTLGGDGTRAFLAVLRAATPVPDPEGRLRLELTGFSGRWLMETLGLSKTAAYRAASALREAGLITVASLPGARGAEGRQRALITGLVGLPGGLSDVTETRRGRRAGSSLSRNLGNRASGPSAVSVNPGNRGANAQVSALSGTTGDRGPLDLEEAGRPSTSLPSASRRSAAEALASLVPAAVEGETDEPYDDETALVFGAFAEWDEVRAVAGLDTRVTYDVLRPIVGDVSSNAGAAVKALGLDEVWGVAVADRVTALLVETLTDTGALASHLWSTIKAAGIVLPEETPPEILAPRLLASLCAALDAKVKSWPGWIGKGLRQPANSYTSSPTLRRAVRAIEDLPTAVSRSGGPQVDQAGPARIEGFAQAFGVEAAPTRTGAPTAPLDDRGGSGPEPEIRSSEEATGAPIVADLDPAQAPAVDSPDPADTAALAAAVEWAGPDHYLGKRGMAHLAAHPRQAQMLLGLWREATGKA